MRVKGFLQRRGRWVVEDLMGKRELWVFEWWGLPPKEKTSQRKGRRGSKQGGVEETQCPPPIPPYSPFVFIFSYSPSFLFIL